jgi:hypothetical protein
MNYERLNRIAKKAAPRGWELVKIQRSPEAAEFEMVFSTGMEGEGAYAAIGMTEKDAKRHGKGLGRWLTGQLKQLAQQMRSGDMPSELRPD